MPFRLYVRWVNDIRHKNKKLLEELLRKSYKLWLMLALRTVYLPFLPFLVCLLILLVSLLFPFVFSTPITAFFQNKDLSEEVLIKKAIALGRYWLSVSSCVRPYVVHYPIYRSPLCQIFVWYLERWATLSERRPCTIDSRKYAL